MLRVSLNSSGPSVRAAQLPSPEEAKFKVLIKSKVGKIGTTAQAAHRKATGLSLANRGQTTVGSTSTALWRARSSMFGSNPHSEDGHEPDDDPKKLQELEEGCIPELFELVRYSDFVDRSNLLN